MRSCDSNSFLWLHSIDGVTYNHDVAIDRGKVRKRKKKASKKFREAFEHMRAETAKTNVILARDFLSSAPCQ
jgi:hypothetical protein